MATAAHLQICHLTRKLTDETADHGTFLKHGVSFSTVGDSKRTWDSVRYKSCNNNNRNGSNNNGARGKAFVIGLGKARTDNNVVMGMCSLNDTLASILYDTGADYSFVSSKLSKQLGMVPTLRDTPYSIELADGKPVEVTHIHRDCKPSWMGNHLPSTFYLSPLEALISWLAWTGCPSNTLKFSVGRRLFVFPLPSGELLSIQGDRGGAMVGIISYLKAQKCIRKGCPAILANISGTRAGTEIKIETSQWSEISQMSSQRNYLDFHPFVKWSSRLTLHLEQHQLRAHRTV